MSDRLEYKKQWYQNNRDRVLAKQKDYNNEHKDVIADYQKAYLVENKDKVIQARQDYYQNNKVKINRRNIENDLKRRARDPAYKLRRNCSCMIWQALNGKKRGASILSFLPYSMEDLKQHLEKLFDDKMSWDNYGSYWHIDHIIPQSRLPYTSMSDENFQKCWALSNLRPLEAIENIKKSNK